MGFKRNNTSIVLSSPQKLKVLQTIQKDKKTLSLLFFSAVPSVDYLDLFCMAACRPHGAQREDIRSGGWRWGFLFIHWVKDGGTVNWLLTDARRHHLFVRVCGLVHGEVKVTRGQILPPLEDPQREGKTGGDSHQAAQALGGDDVKLQTGSDWQKSQKEQLKWGFHSKKSKKSRVLSLIFEKFQAFLFWQIHRISSVFFLQSQQNN